MAGAFTLRLVPRLAAEPPGRGKGGGGGANRDAGSRALVSKKPNKQQHLWIRKETAGSGKKALRLIDAIFADMEELGVRPDEDTARRIGKAFVASGQEEKEKHVLEKYLKKWKYIHFNGERVRVRRDGPLA